MARSTPSASTAHSWPEPSHRIRMTARAGALALVSMLVLMLGLAPARTYIRQRGELNDLRARVEQVQRQNADLQRSLDRLEDPEYLEKMARMCLGMVKKGEIAFVAVPEKGALKPPAC